MRTRRVEMPPCETIEELIEMLADIVLNESEKPPPQGRVRIDSPEATAFFGYKGRRFVVTVSAETFVGIQEK